MDTEHIASAKKAAMLPYNVKLLRRTSYFAGIALYTTE